MVKLEKDSEKLILKVAQKHFVSKGYVATRTQDIADDAGINKALLHYYYRNKEKLYKAVISKAFGEVMPIFASAFASNGTFWDKIKKIINTYIDTLRSHPELPIFIMTELSQNNVSLIEELKKHSAIQPSIQQFLKDIETEVATGNIREISSPQLVLNIIGMSVFPFMAKPIFTKLFEIPSEAFGALMEERKQTIYNFIRNAIEVK